jgi:hypothetical protein
MNPDIKKTELDRHALAINVWENEGGSRAPDTPDGQFGRRVERDRSWTVYHVRIPARSRALRDRGADGILSSAAPTTRCRPPHRVHVGIHLGDVVEEAVARRKCFLLKPERT